MTNLFLFPVQKSWIAEKLKPAVQVVLDNLRSPASKRTYRHFLDLFFHWHGETYGGQMMTRSTVLEFVTWMREKRQKPLGAASVNLALVAVRRLAGEACELKLLPLEIAASIGRVKSVPRQGVRRGRWLNEEEAGRFLAAAADHTLLGLRDRALLAVLLSCGLRRKEAAGLRLDQVQQVWARWALMNLLVMGGRRRDVPMADWCKSALDAWTGAAGIQDGPLFRKLTNDVVSPRGITDYLIGKIIDAAGRRIAMDVAPHDLRRTFAKLARKGGADLEQIQLSLGHKSITTTMVYVGEHQDFEQAPCDAIRIGPGKSADAGKEHTQRRFNVQGR